MKSIVPDIILAFSDVEKCFLTRFSKGKLVIYMMNIDGWVGIRGVGQTGFSIPFPDHNSATV